MDPVIRTNNSFEGIEYKEISKDGVVGVHFNLKHHLKQEYMEKINRLVDEYRRKIDRDFKTSTYVHYVDPIANTLASKARLIVSAKKEEINDLFIDLLVKIKNLVVRSDVEQQNELDETFNIINTYVGIELSNTATNQHEEFSVSADTQSFSFTLSNTPVIGTLLIRYYIGENLPEKLVECEIKYDGTYEDTRCAITISGTNGTITMKNDYIIPAGSVVSADYATV